LVLLLSLAVCQPLATAREDTAAAPERPASAGNIPEVNLRNLTLEPSFVSDREVNLTFASFIFGGMVLFVQFLLLRGRNFSADEILRNYSVTVIIVATLAVVSGGFNDKLVNAVIGLFGTIAGYLLGRSVDGGRARLSKGSEDKEAGS